MAFPLHKPYIQLIQVSTSILDIYLKFLKCLVIFACLQTCNKTQVYTTCINLQLLYALVLIHYQTTKFEWVKIVWDVLRWHWTSHLTRPHRREQRIWYPLPQCLDLFMLLEHAWQMINIISIHHQSIDWIWFWMVCFFGCAGRLNYKDSLLVMIWGFTTTTAASHLLHAIHAGLRSWTFRK